MDESEKQRQGDEGDEGLSEEEVEFWMGAALEEARRGSKADQIPVGCVFIRHHEGRYKAESSSHNLTNLHKNASRHCQINCFLQMQNSLSKQEIASCILFVTVEPCIMCTFALNLMGIKKVIFGQFNDKFGGCGSLRKDNQFETRGGVREKESLEIIKEFYERGNQSIPEEMRNRNNKKVKTNEK